ncbi:hypothetical protein RI543_003448 [Arxiozyma heterogenica]|uniref:Transmembrane protein n=2 Tax=Arxiozyma heterogenica TaxID=278026 RepID=A0AAN7W284_9SACH|nr:hypothetical protein RI543_003448 [Kazachstania heterogenica]
MSVTWSLYNLALFWKCLYDDLKQYKPWMKFMCVKLIIFASYWQGMILKFLSFTGKLHIDSEINGENVPYIYQNGLLCIEMIGFAILHFLAFPWTDYCLQAMPNSARMKLWYSIRDCFGGGDLIWDFKQTLFIGDSYYNFRNFLPSESTSMTHINNLMTNMDRLNKGLRFANNGQDTYWVNYGSITDRQEFLEQNNKQTDNTNVKEEQWIDNLFDTNNRYLPEDKNYPVEWNPQSHKYTEQIMSLRNEIEVRTHSNSNNHTIV